MYLLGDGERREPRSRCPCSSLCMRGLGACAGLGIPFELGTPDEGADLSLEDTASWAARRPSPGFRLPSSSPTSAGERKRYKEMSCVAPLERILFVVGGRASLWGTRIANP